MKMSISIEKQDQIGLIYVDNPPVNALSESVASGIIEAIETLESDSAIRAIVLTTRGRTFVAGADVRKFEQMIVERKCHLGAGLYEVTNRVEQCKKPVVCAMFGTTLGGGLELAMACHYRIASKNSLLGQPEVKLGLIPGAGGTQRLPRLCGIVKAAELCAFGDAISAEEAFELGIVDQISESDLNTDAIEYALNVSNLGPKRTCDQAEKLTLKSKEESELQKIRQLAQEKFQGATCSGLAIDAVSKSSMLSFEDGLTIENDLFVKALSSPEAHALISLFFAERAITKVAGVTKDTVCRSIDSVAFLGLNQPYGAILPSLIQNELDIQLAYQSVPARPCDIVFVDEWDETILSTVTLMNDPIVVLTTDEFSAGEISGGEFNKGEGVRPHLLGLKITWNSGSAFAEIGINEDTSPTATATLIQLMKKLKIPFVVEKPNRQYASDRIAKHRFDSSDLLIEAWQLVNEKVVERMSDIDVIQVNCFKTPRHHANVGLSVETTN